MKKIIIGILCFIVLSIGIVSYMYFTAYRIPTILYHCVEKTYPKKTAYLYVTPEKFKEQMTAIKNAGYNTISYQQLINYVDKGVSLPKNPILVDFDDGYVDNYTYAYPVLKDLNMKATIFIVTGNIRTDPKVGNQHFLTWSNCSEMQQSGLVDIQCHTVTHRDLSTLSIKEIDKEIINCKAEIEKKLGKTANILALPYSGGNATVIARAKKAGIRVVDYVSPHVKNKLFFNDLYSLRRIEVDNTSSGEDLLKLINKS